MVFYKDCKKLHQVLGFFFGYVNWTSFLFILNKLCVKYNGFSREIGGILEPPVTPIGRDELALKRHRFFSDLLSAAQTAAEHRVRFDSVRTNTTGKYNKSKLNFLILALEDVFFLIY